MHIVWVAWILYILKTFTVVKVSISVTSASKSGVWWMKGYFLLYPEGRNTAKPANKHSPSYIFTPQCPYSFHNRNTTGRPYSQMSPVSSLKDLIGSKVCQKVRIAYPCNAGSLLATGPPILMGANHKYYNGRIFHRSFITMNYIWRSPQYIISTSEWRTVR